MEKVNKAVDTYTDTRLDNILVRIATDYEIPLQDLKQYTEIQLQDRKRCIGKLKNGKPCTHHTHKELDFCLKHKYQLNEEITHELEQCVAMNKNGQRCIRNAIQGKDVCGLHRFIGTVSKMNSSMDTCAYYDDDDDQNHIFCNHYAMKNIWFCKKHAHHQNVYVHQFKANNLNHYKERVHNNEIQPNAVIEEILK